MNFYHFLAIALLLLNSNIVRASDNVIEKQLEDIGSVPNDEIVVVQRKYTRKVWRSEFTPIILGGMPFGTVRRTLFAGANYNLHVNDWFSWQAFNFTYQKTFFSSFTDDINANKTRTTQNDIQPNYQKLLYFLTTGVQFTPFYGKMSTFSHWIAYMEPYLAFDVGYAKTESDGYATFAPGIGLRVFFKEWFSMKLEFRDYMYTENDVSLTTGQLTNNFQSNYAVMVGFSFWLPKMPR